jgi:hypothetical protein
MSQDSTILDLNLQPVDWKTIDDAIYDWLDDLLGLPIIWENQGVPQPAYPYISILRNPEVDEGGIDELRTVTVDDQGRVVTPGSGFTPDRNEEIAYQPVQFTVTIQAHVGSGPADLCQPQNDPNNNGMKLMAKAKRSLGQTSVKQELSAAGISVVRPQEIQDTSLAIGGDWISRGTLDVMFRTASVMTERLGFFDKVELVSTELGIDTIVDAS